MKIKTINISPYLVTSGWTIFLCSMTALCHAEISMNDQQLSEQIGHATQLSPIVITAVAADLKQSTEDQGFIHTKLAQANTDVVQRTNIYTTVLTDYELQKKHPSPNIDTDQYSLPTTQSKVIEVGESPYQKHNVRVTTEDKITVYIGHERD